MCYFANARHKSTHQLPVVGWFIPSTADQKLIASIKQLTNNTTDASESYMIDMVFHENIWEEKNKLQLS